jgi:hypothetical protein
MDSFTLRLHHAIDPIWTYDWFDPRARQQPTAYYRR